MTYAFPSAAPTHAASAHPSLNRSTLALLLALGALPALAQDGSDSATTLPTVTVTGTIEERATGPVVGHIATRSATATKTDTPLVETAQSVSVITADRIRDQGARTVQETLRYSAGVYAETYGLDSRGDWSLVRGTAPVQYLDGLQQSFGAYTNVRPDPFTLERVEVLKGPSSVLYGQGSVGGITNLVSKRPLTPPATPAAWSSEAIGPWTLTPAPADDGPPYVHDGERIKDFRFVTCEGCGAQMRSGVARVAVTAPQLGPGIDGIVHGHGDHLEAHVPWPEQTGDDHRLWVTVQDWSGNTHSTSWSLKR